LEQSLGGYFLALNLVLTAATYIVALRVEQDSDWIVPVLTGITSIFTVPAYHCKTHTLIAVMQGSPPSSISFSSSSVMSNQSCVLHTGALIQLRFIPNHNHVQISLFFIYYPLVILIFTWWKPTKVSYYLVQCTIGSHSRSLSSWSLTVGIFM